MWRTILVGILMLGIAGCSGPDAGPVPAITTSSPTEAPGISSSPSQEPILVGPAAPVPSFTGAFAADEVATWSFNASGNFAVRFVQTAPKGVYCSVEFKVNYHFDADTGGVFIVEGTSGAGFVHYQAGPFHVGPIKNEAAVYEDVYHVTNTIAGENWGSHPYTLAVEDMQWWPNHYQPNGTFAVAATCDAPFTIHELRASRTATTFTDGDFRGGVNLGWVGDAAVADALTLEAEGANPMLIGLPFGFVGALQLDGRHDGGEFSWQTAAQDDNRFLVQDIAPGPLELELNASTETIAFVLADLPLCDQACQEGMAAVHEPPE